MPRWNWQKGTEKKKKKTARLLQIVKEIKKKKFKNRRLLLLKKIKRQLMSLWRCRCAKIEAGRQITLWKGKTVWLQVIMPMGPFTFISGHSEKTLGLILYLLR